MAGSNSCSCSPAAPSPVTQGDVVNLIDHRVPPIAASKRPSRWPLRRDKNGSGILNFTRAHALRRRIEQRRFADRQVAGHHDGSAPDAHNPHLLAPGTTTFQVIDSVNVNPPITIASPVAEAPQSPKTPLTFTTLSVRVKVIATWIPATRQSLVRAGRAGHYVPFQLGGSCFGIVHL
jgi:hypothetical protein